MAVDYSSAHGDLLASAKQLRTAAPEMYKHFGSLHMQTMADGALSAKVKELMALAIGIQAGCEGCIVFHAAGAAKHGATREEALEAIGVAVMMGGGPGSIYGAKALDAFDQLSDKG